MKKWDYPNNLGVRQNKLGDQIRRIGLKVRSQAMMNHPEDYDWMISALTEATEELEEMLEELKHLPSNQ